MVAKPLRTKPKSASAERCLRSLGATIDMATPDMETSNCPVRGVLSHGGLRKGNQEVAVITGFYRSPGIAEQIFAEHWEAFQHAHPRYQTSYYDGLVAKMLACGNPDLM